jgi:UDP-N-acetylmuramoyl-tripeptide--D-alanyl-D-alanine ligase
MELKISEILKATKGNLLTGSHEGTVVDLSIDSRKTTACNLFVPLQGEHCDGHIFIETAFRQGANASLVKKGSPVVQKLMGASLGKPLIEVDDPLTALGDIAHFWRNKFSVKIVAITGSNGKTTTKEMTWNIISEKISSIKNPGNWNNLIGLPLSLFQLNRGHKVAVLEMGMNEKGEIDRLAEICQPQTGLITNIGPCHLEKLPSINDVMNAKAELFEHLGHSDTAIINNDDPRVVSLAERTSAKTISFGMENSDIHASNVRGCNCFGTEFDLCVREEKTTVKLQLLGKQFLSNALAAAAIAHSLGINIEDIKSGLESFETVPGRMETIKVGSARIINDTYNANPVSMQASLSALSSLAFGKQKIAVLGDMLELGSESIKFHMELGKNAAHSNLDRLFLAGEFSSSVKEGAVSAGMDSRKITVCGDLTELASILNRTIGKGDSILIKGSRKLKLEKVIDLLQQLNQ